MQRLLIGSYGNQYYGEGNYVDPSDAGNQHLKAMQDHFYQSSYPANAAYWVQGSIDKRFKCGDQTLWNMIYGDNQYFQSRRFFFNLIMRHINMIAGRQRQNRKSPVTLPTQSNTDPLSDDYNKALKWVENRNGFQEYLSQAFEGALDTGMTLMHYYPDYTFDPISGDLFCDQVAYNNFLIDPYWRKMDFSDCNFVWRRQWVTKNAAKALLPGYAKEIDRMRPSGMKDGRFPLQAELLNLATNDLFALDEFHYRDTREATIVLDPYTQEAVEWEKDEQDDDDMMERTLAKQPWLVVQKRQVPTVKLVLTLAGKTVYHGPNLLNIDTYPFVPTLCYHQPDIQSYQWRTFGVVRNLRDAQYLYNMRKVIEMDLLQSQVQNAWIYPVDKVVDTKAFRQTQNGVLIPLKAGSLPSDIQRLDPQGIPSSVLELSRSLSEDITRISGVNEELLGSASDDIAGILSMARQGAGLVTLQTIFDKLDYTQRLCAGIELQFIRKNFSKSKITQILGHEPDPRFFTSHSLKYSIAVEEGNYSTTQRQMELMQLLHFKQLGMPIADKSILDAAFITNKEQVKKDMQEQVQQQQDVQNRQAQQDAKKDQADIMAKFAKSQNDLAGAQEKLARIGEINSSAEHNQAEADLALVKEMITLEDMDLENFRKSLELAQAIKLANQPLQHNQGLANG